ncbi:MAG: DinB family protein [Actinomycetota bacterium]
MPITPDTKDWTWVLQRPCTECGFDVRSFPREDMGRLLRENAREWTPLLAHPLATERPNDHTWSALEYACHVRDVFKLYDYRLDLMLAEDDPLYPNWDQDETAVADRYDRQDPDVVAEELERAAHALADRFDEVEGQAWERTGRRSDGASFTIESFARYLIHDPIHHLHDVRSGFAALEDR